MTTFAQSYFSMRKAKAPWNPDEHLHPSMKWALPNKKIGWKGVPSLEKFVQRVMRDNPGVTKKEVRQLYWDLLTSRRDHGSFYEQYLGALGEHQSEKEISPSISEIQQRTAARESARETTQSRRNQIDRTLRNLYWSVAPLHYQAWEKASPEIRKQLVEAAPHTFLPLQDGNSVDDEQNDDSPFWNYLVHYRRNGFSPHGRDVDPILEKIDTIKNMDDEKDISKEKIHNLLTAMGWEKWPKWDGRGQLNEQSYWNFISKTLPDQHKKLQEILQKHKLLSPEDLEKHDGHMNQAIQWFAIPSPEQSRFESLGVTPDKIQIGVPRQMDDSPAEPPSPASSSPMPRTPATNATGAMTREAATRLSEWGRMQRSLFPFAIWPNTSEGLA